MQNSTRDSRQAIGFVIVVLVFLVESTASARAQGGITNWKEPVNFSRVSDLISYTPVLLCDANQNTHMFWAERIDQEAYIYYNSDASGDWQEAVDILATGSVTFLDAAITPDLRVHLVWATGNSGELMYSSVPLVEAGNPWKWPSPHAIAAGVNVLSTVYGGGNTLYADSEGVLHLVYSIGNDSNGFSNTLYYVRSEDGGDSWSSQSLVTTVAAPEPSNMSGNIAVDEEGRLHVAWDVRSNQYGSFSRLGYIRSTDAGKTWDHALDLARGNPPYGVAMAAVFAFGDGKVHLTWDTPARLHQWSSDGGESWSTPVLIMDLGAAFGGFNKLARDSGGLLHVVAAVGGGVYHATSTGSGWNPAEAIDTRPFDPHGQQLVICQGNRLHVSYYDRIAENEIWYSTKTIKGPELKRTSISISEAPPTSVPPMAAVPSDSISEALPASVPSMVAAPSESSAEAATTLTPSVLPELSDDALPKHPSALAAMIFGFVPAGILVIIVVAAKMAHGRRYRQ